MIGADVKRQVLEALDAVGLGYAQAALAPCVVLTREEADDMAEAIDWALGGNTTFLADVLALLSPDEADDE